MSAPGLTSGTAQAGGMTASPAHDIVEVLARLLPAGGSLHEPEFAGNELDYVRECIETGWVSSVGAFVDRFEDMLRDITGAEHVIATVNGTAALHAALLLAGVKPDDEVLTPGFGFVAAANAVSYCGATPHFVDVDARTLGVDPAALSDHLKRTLDRRNGVATNRETGRPVRALMVAHILGHPAALDAIGAVAAGYDIPIVEDAAESLGSLYRNRHTGTLGLTGALSFNGNKTVTTGGGGALLTNDPKIGEFARHLTTTAKLPHPWEYRHDHIGFNYRMPNINAALGCAQLERLEAFVTAKRRLAGKYREAFAGIDGVSVVEEPAGARSNYWLNALLLDREDPAMRDEVHRLAHAQKIMTRSAWAPLHTLPMYASCPRMAMTATESLCERMIKLPSSPHLAGTEG